MNSILNNPRFRKPMSFKEFAVDMTPEKAKAQIEQMVASGQISQTQLDQAKQQATSLLNLLNR